MYTNERSDKAYFFSHKKKREISKVLQLQRLMHIKPGNGKAYTKPNTTIMLLIILGVFKDLQTAVNERVYNIVWVMKRCVGESVMMEIGHIHLGSAKVTDVWLELWSG